MTEPEFRHFYEHTARALAAFLYRLTGDRTQAEDLMQESFVRLLGAETGHLDAAQRKSYLYKIGLNLVRDQARRTHAVPLEPHHEPASPPEAGGAQVDVQRLLTQVPERDRTLLWLAYGEGASHREIASVTGLKEESVRPMLFRARQRAAQLLRRLR